MQSACMQNFSREFNGIQRQQQYNDEEKTNIDKLEKKQITFHW